MPIIDQRLANIREFLKKFYFSLAPKGSWLYSATHTAVRQLLNQRYRYWIMHFDSISKADNQRIDQEIASLLHKPIISVIMPVFNSDLEFLDQAIQSVRDQVYPHWQLCIADDASTKPGVIEIIQKHCNEDPKITAVYRNSNGHISAASNSALALATGQYLALLDHDDVLHPMALFEVAKEINAHPKCAVIFSDEDKITPKGKRIDPYFKSDFDYDLFLSQNMVSHLGVYRRDLIERIEGFREGLEGSQDYDLLLRLLPIIKIDQIRHIPKVLYHWRISAKSAADSIEIKPYALEAGKKALSDYLARKTIQSEVNTFENFGYKISYALPLSQTSVETIVLIQTPLVNFPEGINTVLGQAQDDFIKHQVRLVSLEENRNILADSLKYGLIDEVLTYKLPEVNLASVLNQLIENSTAEYITLIEADCIQASPGWLTNLISFAQQPGVGMVSPRLIDKNGLIISCGLILSEQFFAQRLFFGALASIKNYYFGWSNLHKGYSALPADCLVFNKSDFNASGGFDITLTDHSARCLELCLKMKTAGLRNLLVPEINLTLSHLVKQNSAELAVNEADRYELLIRHHQYFTNDPAFNPNLIVRNGKPTITREPRTILSE